MRLFKLLLCGIFLAAIWSCSDLGDPYVEAECPDDQIKDCAGVCGGTAVLDECDICSGDGLTCNVDYSTQIQPIFTSNCNGCHIGGTSGGLNLSVGSSYNNLVNVTSPNYSPALRVNPSSASTSVLWNKIAGGTNGSQMPMNGPYLSQADIDLIETWINEGAQDN